MDFFTEGRAIRQCSSLMVENQPKCSLYASTQQCNCNTDECNVDQNCACNKGQGSIVMSFLPLIIQPMIVTFLLNYNEKKGKGKAYFFYCIITLTKYIDIRIKNT